MPSASICPSALELQGLLSGALAPADADALEQHVEGCSTCQGLLETCDSADGLVQTVRAMATRPRATLPAAVDQLIAHLAHQAALSTGSAVTLGCAETSQGTNLDIAALLMPPQGPGEIGRLGVYRILSVLGQGGMGIVFRAEDMQLQRQVALKVINPRLASSATARERFLREARSAAAIEHDHIVPLYQAGEDGGVPYLAFPLLKGETLDERLKREQRLPLPEVLRIGREIAAGLHAAHAHGLIHRDIKPANIFLEMGGVAATSHHAPLPPQQTRARVKILDFGLARAAAEVRHGSEEQEGTAADAMLTHTGAVLGTPAYMAPEQARAGIVDARADLYSLGAVLYRMATGQTPFPGRDARAVLAALQKDPPAAPQLVNPKIPAPLSRLILALLAKTPADRPASASAVAERLAALEQRGRRRWWAIAAAGLLAASLALAAFFWFRPNADDHLLDPAGDGAEALVAGVEFVPAAEYDVGMNPCAVAVGDLNGDGHADLVVVNQGERGAKLEDYTPSTVSVLLGNGDGAFKKAVNYPIGKGPSSVCLTDLNGDGRQDIVVTDFNGTHGISVLLGNGDGTFQPAVRHAVGGRHPVRVLAADFNGDGKMDLAVAIGFHEGGVSVLLGKGDGSFRAPVFYATGVHTERILTGDFNGDGRLDLAASNGTSETLSLLLGNGDGTFQAPLNHRINGGRPRLAGAADFDGDGKLDLAVGIVRGPDEHFVRLLLGKGSGAFRDGSRLAGGLCDVVADFNGDGKADIVALDPLPMDGHLHVHLGKGWGAFQSGPPTKLGFCPRAVAIGDFNGDGRPDLAVIVDWSPKVRVLLNRAVVERLRVSDAVFTAGQPGFILITAQDATGATAVGYTGTVRIACDGEQQGLPAEFAFTVGDKGVQPFDALVFAKPGRYTITATDAANPTLRATGTIHVQPRQP